jgi:ABC-type spermidine/putrescine transport system permease subunit II
MRLLSLHNGGGIFAAGPIVATILSFPVFMLVIFSFESDQGFAAHPGFPIAHPPWSVNKSAGAMRITFS